MVVHKVDLLLGIIDLVAADEPKVSGFVECFHLSISLRVLGRDGKIWDCGKLVSLEDVLDLLLICEK